MLASCGRLLRRLVTHPRCLIVDGERPSIDHANPGDAAADRQRPDFRLSAASPLDRQASSRHWATCHSGMPAASAGGRWWAIRRRACSIRPSGRPGVGRRSLLGWLTVGHLFWGGMGVYVLLRSARSGPMGGDGGRRRLPGFAVPAGAHVRGALPARLGGSLVSLGVLGTWRGATRAALAGD